MMNKIRLSYSLISMFERGDYQACIDMYLHKDRAVSRQMQEGKEIHLDISNYITKNKKLPEIFNFNQPLTNPKPEHTLKVSYNELADLKCIIDLLDEPIMYEFKTGVSDSLEWSRTMQIPMYFLIANLSGIELERAFLIRYNQKADVSDFAVIHNSQKIMDKARNFVDSVCEPMHSFFSEQGLLG